MDLECGNVRVSAEAGEKLHHPGSHLWSLRHNRPPPRQGSSYAVAVSTMRVDRSLRAVA
jgi:hypothetical protein